MYKVLCNDSSPVIQVYFYPKLQFPDCDDNNAISVSCLDLCYCVKARALKDEKKDVTAPVVLLEILEEDKKDCVIMEKGKFLDHLPPYLSLSLLHLTNNLMITLFCCRRREKIILALGALFYHFCCKALYMYIAICNHIYFWITIDSSSFYYTSYKYS